MIRILITALIYLISFFTQAQETPTHQDSISARPSFSIKTNINKLNSDEGFVYFALYESQEDFLNRNYLQARKVKADKNGVDVVFEGIRPGIYAISCFYDKNDNGTMDFDNDGLPLEDYGSTNNIMNFGPPRFSDAKFEVSDKDLTFEIKL